MFESRSSGRAATALAVVALLTCAVEATEAQQRWVAPVDSLRQIQSVSPKSGPVGTRVEIYSDNMPLEATYHVGVGATRSGFESLYEATQLDLGTISVALPIPDQESWDRAIVFVAFNAVFSPIAMSKPFHVTDDEGYIQRTGAVTDSGGSCVTFQDLDRFTYELVGETQGLSAGQQVILRAEYVGDSSCVDGATIRVLEVRAVPDLER